MFFISTIREKLEQMASAGFEAYWRARWNSKTIPQRIACGWFATAKAIAAGGTEADLFKALSGFMRVPMHERPLARMRRVLLAMQSAYMQRRAAE